MVVFAMAALVWGGFTLGREQRETAPEHVHGWSLWQTPIQAALTGEDRVARQTFVQFRQCTNCGLSEMRTVKSNE